MPALESKVTWGAEGLQGKTLLRDFSGIEKEKVGGLQYI